MRRTNGSRRPPSLRGRVTCRATVRPRAAPPSTHGGEKNLEGNRCSGTLKDQASCQRRRACLRDSNEEYAMLIISFLAILVLLVLLTGLRIANQYERAVIFRLGKYARTSGPGLYLLIPVVGWQWTINMRTMTTAVEQQEAITKDNVQIKINAVIWRKTIDPKRAVIEVVDVGDLVVQVAQTALRNIIGQHTLDDVLKEQEAISRALQTSIDDVTEPWGVKVERVQMTNVEIPESMQRAMAQEAEALREKRARQIKAQAEVEAAALLRQAAEIIMQSPAGLELRRMQMMTEVGAEQNTMMIVMMPSEFVDMARGIGQRAGGGAAGKVRVGRKTAAAQRKWSRTPRIHDANAGSRGGRQAPAHDQANAQKYFRGGAARKKQH